MLSPNCGQAEAQDKLRRRALPTNCAAKIIIWSPNYKRSRWLSSRWPLLLAALAALTLLAAAAIKGTSGALAQVDLFGRDREPSSSSKSLGDSSNYQQLNNLFAESKLTLAAAAAASPSASLAIVSDGGRGGGQGQTSGGDYFSQRHRRESQQQQQQEGEGEEHEGAHYPHNTDYEAPTSEQDNNNHQYSDSAASSSSLFDHNDTTNTTLSSNRNRDHNNYSYADQRPLATTTTRATTATTLIGNELAEAEESWPTDEVTLANAAKAADSQKELLGHEQASRACALDRGCQRKDRLNNTYLHYCSRYKLESLLSSEILMSIMHDSSDECERVLSEFIQLDELINRFDLLFKTLLTRYNCNNGYSVKWSCDDCKRAYKDWLCATNLPYYMNGERIKPCISFCERVEQRCPYFHPITKEQYGGQPVFICRDPNIPFVPEITPDIPYSEPSKCYDLCHLSDDEAELRIDSLSKYEYGKCPNKSLIAEEVRSDPLYCNNNNHKVVDDAFRQEQSALNKSQNPLGGEQYGDSSIANTNEGGFYFGEEPTKRPVEGVSGAGFSGPKASSPAGGGAAAATGVVSSKTAAQHVHLKKLHELTEVMTIYKSQPKTHGFGGHHSDQSSHSLPAYHHSEAEPHHYHYL